MGAWKNGIMGNWAGYCTVQDGLTAFSDILRMASKLE